MASIWRPQRGVMRMCPCLGNWWQRHKGASDTGQCFDWSGLGSTLPNYSNTITQWQLDNCHSPAARSHTQCSSGHLKTWQEHILHRQTNKDSSTQVITGKTYCKCLTGSFSLDVYLFVFAAENVYSLQRRERTPPQEITCWGSFP